MDYEKFTEELVKLGFDGGYYHLPYMREDPPQMIVGWVANPMGIQLQIRNKKGFFEQQRVEYIDMYNSTLRQIEFNIELFTSKQNKKAHK
jgi:hypothetical protein